jgi:uncharacterized DUF497 family protein
MELTDDAECLDLYALVDYEVASRSLCAEVQGELRGQTIGMVNGQQILAVARTISEPHDEEVIRIISARKPHRRNAYLCARDLKPLAQNLTGSRPNRSGSWEP